MRRNEPVSVEVDGENLISMSLMYSRGISQPVGERQETSYQNGTKTKLDLIMSQYLQGKT